MYKMSLRQKAVQAYADWVESCSTDSKTFHDWHNEYWPNYENYCYDVSRNIYIMQECVREFERLLQPEMPWEIAIGHSKLLEKQRQVCLSVEVDPDEFFDDATVRIYQQKCLAIWTRYFSDDE